MGHRVRGCFWCLGPEYQEKLRLEEQLRAAEETLKYKRKQIQELRRDVQVSRVHHLCRTDVPRGTLDRLVVWI